MCSLSELLAKEGFEGNDPIKTIKFDHKKVKFGEYTDSIALPIYICRDRKSFDVPRLRRDRKSVPRSGSSVSRKSDEPAIDEVAKKAVVSILSGYVGHYLQDKEFRDGLREKCSSCLVRRSKDLSDNGVFANMELGIESVEKLIENPGTKKELKMKALRNSIGFLTIVASLNSKGSKDGTTSGTPNSHLSACAQLYLSIVYKLEKNNRICARHVLQVFVDSSFLARTHLLPDLWEHFFLPHLLHIKIWFNKQVENISTYDDQEEEMRCLRKAYDDQMDMGTVQFALYYKEWLKTGTQPPNTLPSVPLPSTKVSSSKMRTSPSFTTHSSIKKFLHRAVHGRPLEKQQSMPSMEDYSDGNRSVSMEGKEEKLSSDDYCSYQHNNVEIGKIVHQRSASQCQKDSRKSDYMRYLPCHSEQTEVSIVKACVTTPSDLNGAIITIGTSDSLSECELAIRIIMEAWLDSHGKDPSVEETLLKPSVIEGMLEVLFASNNDEILELVISLLTEFVTRDETHGKIILSLDPQLEAFMRLLRNSSLFLKAASLLHLVKPKAKQMISTEWIPLVLRVLEFGDQLQTLFTVRCSPQVAAYYFLDQLLTGFDEDRNWENGRQVISLGGLNLLLRRMEIGDVVEKTKALSIVYCCIQADGRCRHYLASNLNNEFVLALLVLGKELDCNEIASALLVELVCLHRHIQRISLFKRLLKGWGCLNTMQILLVYLQRETPKERPTVAAVMLQLDLMGDPLKSSVYREEAIEAIIGALDCQTCNEKVQEQAAKALAILGGRFSYTGEPETEKWILKEAGYDESVECSFHEGHHIVDGYKHLDEDEGETENWQRKAAMVLWNSGGKKLIEALSESIANGIPCLARASLVTVAWLSNFIHTVRDEDLIQSAAWSTLVPQLIESLNHDKAFEERVLASFSLLSLSKSSGFIFEMSDKEKKAVLVHLRNISKVTWTAKKLIFIITSSHKIRHPGP